MAEDFDFGMLEGEGSSVDDAGASGEVEIESPNEGVIESASPTDSRSQPQRPAATSNEGSSEEYSPRERALLDRIEQLTNQAYQNGRGQPNIPTFDAQDHNFLDGLDIDEVLSSSENLNKLLLSVYNRGLQESMRMARENWTGEAPNLVREHITQHMTMRELVDGFYSTNPDLQNAKKTVGAIANEVSQENPNLTLDEVFAEAAKRTREVLGLPPQAIQQQQSAVKPNLPSRRQPGNRRNGTNVLTGVAKEIDDLLT